jgi:hypothetical protein
VKDENGDFFANSHNILNKWKNCCSQLLNVHRVSDVRQPVICLERLRITRNDLGKPGLRTAISTSNISNMKRVLANRPRFSCHVKWNPGFYLFFIIFIQKQAHRKMKYILWHKTKWILQHIRREFENTNKIFYFSFFVSICFFIPSIICSSLKNVISSQLPGNYFWSWLT